MQRSFNLKSIFVILVGVFYFFIGYLQLRNGFIHEDAYILFRYSNNLALGGNISFNLDSAPTEGATDFLWMVVIAGMKFIGFDTAIAALIINSLGASMIAWTFYKISFYQVKGFTAIFYVISVSLIVLFSSAATAGYVGFSSMIFSALSITPFYILLSKNLKNYKFIPLISIMIALLRPDGVIIGVAYTLLGIGLLIKQDFSSDFFQHKLILKKYIINAIVSLIVGLTYFFWRLDYFGFLLPLPLIVKSTSDNLFPGLLTSILWLYDLRPLVILLILMIIINNKRIENLHYLILVSIPILIHQFSLIFAHQSQNVDFRFQSPALIMLYFVVFLLISKMNNMKKIQLIALFFVILFSMPNSSRNAILNLTRTGTINNSRSYIDTYSFTLGKVLSDSDKIVLTEAGRLAYWNNSIIIDVVGLNDPYSAVNIPDTTYIGSFDPAIVMLHIADSLYYDEFFLKALSQNQITNFNIINIDHLQLTEFIREEYKYILDLDSSSEYPDIITTTLAPIKLLQFLHDNNDDYTVVVVRYYDSFVHIYGFNKHHPQHDLFLSLLSESFEENQYKGYLDLRILS